MFATGDAAGVDRAKLGTLIVVAALLLLAVPDGSAHGTLHGQGIPRQFTAPVQIDAENSTTVTVLYQSANGQNLSFNPGDLFLLTGEARGGPVQVSLKRTLEDASTALVAAWQFQEGPAETKGVLLPGPGEYSLVIETTSESPVQLTFLFDHTDLPAPGCTCGPRWLASQPRSAAGVFTVDVPDAGPYAAFITEPAAHHLDVAVYEPLRDGAPFPEGFRLLDRSTNDDLDSEVVTHRLSWDADPAARYYVIMTSLEEGGFKSRAAPAEAPSPWHALFDAGPSKSVGSPSPLSLAFAALALALFSRGSRR